MAPRKKYTKQSIIDAAFEIARIEGMDSITIRKVAHQLGSSIAPIYVNFKDVDELIKEVVNKTFAVSRELLQKQNTGSPFRDIGLASIQFAKEYSILFQDIVMTNNEHMKNTDDETDIIDQMRTDPTLSGFSDGELKSILLKMKVFQTGLSVMAANGLLSADFTEEKLIVLLDDTAEDVITGERLRQSKN